MPYYIRPFAEEGDKSPIQTDGTPTGEVSYQQGYGPNYQIDPADAGARRLNRLRFNEIVYAITLEIQKYQQHGTPDFITAADNGGVAYSYGINDTVRYDPGTGFKVYLSLVDGNTEIPTVATNWLDTTTYATQASISGLVPETRKISTLNSSGLFGGTELDRDLSLRLAIERLNQVGQTDTNFLIAGASNNESRTMSIPNFKNSIGVQLLNGNTFSGNLTVNGTISGTAVVDTSDERLKNKKEKLDSCHSLESVINWRKYLIEYNELAKSNFNGKGEKYTFFANDVEKTHPKAVLKLSDKDNNETDYKGINYTNLIVVLASAIEELELRVKNLESVLKENGFQI